MKARAGEAAVAPQLLQGAFSELLNPAAQPDDEGQRLLQMLTPREVEVLVRVADGEDTRLIAAGMGIAPSTARTHVQRVLMKLGVGSRLEAAALAARTGLLDRAGPMPHRCRTRRPRTRPGPGPGAGVGAGVAAAAPAPCRGAVRAPAASGGYSAGRSVGRSRSGVGGAVGRSFSQTRKNRPRASMPRPVHRLMLMSSAFFRSASDAVMPAIVTMTP